MRVFQQISTLSSFLFTLETAYLVSFLIAIHKILWLNIYTFIFATPVYRFNLSTKGNPMRPSPRLSLFAACCTVAMLVCTAKADITTYTLASDDTTMLAEGWVFDFSGQNRTGYYYINNPSKGIYSPVFENAIITNVVLRGYRTGSCTRSLHFYANNSLVETIDYSDIGTSPSDFYSVSFSQQSGITSFHVVSDTSGNYHIYLLAITVYTADFAPVVGEIEDQEIGTNGTTSVEFGVDLHGRWEQVELSVVAENLDSPLTPVPANSHWINDDIYGHQTCIFNFSPSIAGITSGRIRFTITATGQGGSTSQSFVWTVVPRAVKTKPMITSVPMLQGIQANRPFTSGIEVTEADGDEVTVTVSATCNGPHSYNPATGIFTFTPTSADVALSPITFTVRATDTEGTDEDSFILYVEPVSAPTITIEPSKDQTVAYGSGVLYYVTFGETDDDEITDSGVSVKPGTEDPIGTTDYYTYTFDPNSYAFVFSPDISDIGKTFTFTASATDFDGTTNVDFHATVILAAPVLKHCPLEDWTTTNFTADIEVTVPGATSYRLRYIYTDANSTIVTDYVDNVTFPCVVSNLDSTSYTYAVQAQRGAINSAWSNEETVLLDTYLPPTYAIPMTGRTHGSYSEDFNGLISSGSAPWYDARTIPGWYAVSNNVNSYSNMKYLANSGGSSGTGILSLRVDTNNVPNRALGVRARVKADNFSFGVVFTNRCVYAVTNITVSFTPMQFRAFKDATCTLRFHYFRAGEFFTPSTKGVSWIPVEALNFLSPHTTGDKAEELCPPRKGEPSELSANIAFEGENALLPGEVIALRWYLDASQNQPTLGIDDLTVSWQCAWPRQTVIYVQ